MSELSEKIKEFSTLIKFNEVSNKVKFIKTSNGNVVACLENGFGPVVQAHTEDEAMSLLNEYHKIFFSLQDVIFIGQLWERYKDLPEITRRGNIAKDYSEFISKRENPSLYVGK